MKIVIDGTVYAYDGRMRLLEAIRVKQRLGLTLVDFEQGVNHGDPVALQALLWLVRHRAGETDLDPADVDCDLGDLRLELEEQPEGSGDPPPAGGGHNGATTTTPPAASTSASSRTSSTSARRKSTSSG